MILAFLNFYNTPMPPIKFNLNQIYRLGADDLNIFKTAAKVAILDIKTEPF